MTPSKNKSPLGILHAVSGQTAGIGALALVLYFLLQFLGGLQDFAANQLLREDRLLEEERKQTSKLDTVDGRLAELATRMETLGRSAQDCAHLPRRGMPLAKEGIPLTTRRPSYLLERE